MKWAASLFAIAVAFAATGCAPIPPANTTQIDKPAVSAEIIRFEIPADALGARDPQLTAILAKQARSQPRRSNRRRFSSPRSRRTSPTSTRRSGKACRRSTRSGSASKI